MSDRPPSPLPLPLTLAMNDTPVRYREPKTPYLRLMSTSTETIRRAYRTGNDATQPDDEKSRLP